MCQSIARPCGEDIETGRELKEFLNGGPIIMYREQDELEEDVCLCAVDLRKTLEANHIPYTEQWFGFEVTINQAEE
jgi:hypothetical protein